MKARVGSNGRILGILPDDTDVADAIDVSHVPPEYLKSNNKLFFKDGQWHYEKSAFTIIAIPNPRKSAPTPTLDAFSAAEATEIRQVLVDIQKPGKDLQAAMKAAAEPADAPAPKAPKGSKSRKSKK